jgi:hypothetical protein
MYVTVQVPQQQVLGEHSFALQPVHIVQGANTQEQGIVAQVNYCVIDYNPWLNPLFS